MSSLPSVPSVVLGMPLERSQWLDDLIKKMLRYLNRTITQVIDQLPGFLESTFSPQLIVKHVALVGTLQVFIMGWSASVQMVTWCWQHFTVKGQKIIYYQKKMKCAKTYSEWLKSAEALDKVRGLDRWRNQDFSPLLNIRSLRKYIADTENMMKKKHIFDLMFRLRGGLTRDQYGIMDKGLYTLASAGTKKVIEYYHSTVSNALDLICDADTDDIPDEAKLAFFNEARHAYGRTALSLSGGAYLGFYQMGVAKALFERGLLPRVISGASAGSLLAAVLGCKTDEELTHIFSQTETGGDAGYRTRYFEYSTKINNPLGSSIQQALPEFLRPLVNPLLYFFFDGKFVNMDMKYLQEQCIHNVGRYTFQEAFDRTGRIINITVAPQNSYDPPRLLNYLTAPHVCVWSAACASCAIPGIFDAGELIVKEPSGEYCPESYAEEKRSIAARAESSPRTRTRTSSNASSTPVPIGSGIAIPRGDHAAPRAKVGYTDGSIESDLPMQQLSELFNVNHFIVSQVNPHSAIFSTLSLRGNFNERSFLLRSLVAYTHFLKEQVKSWVKNLADFVLSFAPHIPQWALKRGMYSTLTQSYEGRENDITIMPWANHISVLQAWSSIIHNPSDAEYLEMVHASEVAVWDNMSRIQAQCKVEMTLDRNVQKLRRRIALKEQQILVEDEGEGGAEEEEEGKIGRVPSFYTARSIVNLSGLSVADPAVVLDTEGLHLKKLSGEHKRSSFGIDMDEIDEKESINNKPVHVTKTTNMANFYYKKADKRKS
jgi:TAG lipase / steryl ester hydrolase / phospholipase A2 / LPA acyltransferase